MTLLIEAGADLNRITADHHMTALMYASMHGHLEVVKVLVGAGAKVEMQNFDKHTAEIRQNLERGTAL